MPAPAADAPSPPSAGSPREAAPAGAAAGSENRFLKSFFAALGAAGPPPPAPAPRKTGPRRR